MRLGRTTPLRRELARALPERPFGVEFWDGSSLPATTTADGSSARFIARSPDAVAHLIRAPGQLGIGRAYATGALDVDDLDAAFQVVDRWKPPPLPTAEKARLALAALAACGPMLPPRTPAAELKLSGARHSPERDARAVRHHYDVSNEFFSLFLDESMTYSCAFFSRGADTLAEAQRAKLELSAAKLAMEPGARVLDVGCGWGSFAIHLASEHGAQVVGITLSEPQAELARQRVRDAGAADRVEIRVADYRELRNERFDRVASIGMVEHVGEEQIDVYADQLARLLEPGGLVLNHGIARLRHDSAPAGPFSERYVFPDGDPLPVSRVIGAFERAGLVPQHVEGFQEDYAETLRHWARRLDERFEDAVRLAGHERARVWRLYLRAARNGFETGYTSIFQVLCRKPAP